MSPYDDMQDRLLSNSVLDPETGCWIWLARKSRKGYGRISIRVAGKKYPQAMAAHRVSYEAFVGPIPEELQIDHKCVNPSCIAPNHLEPVTLQENIRRRCLRRKMHIETVEEIEHELDQGI